LVVSLSATERGAGGRIDLEVFADGADDGDEALELSFTVLEDAEVDGDSFLSGRKVEVGIDLGSIDVTDTAAIVERVSAGLREAGFDVGPADGDSLAVAGFGDDATPVILNDAVASGTIEADIDASTGLGVASSQGLLTFLDLRRADVSGAAKVNLNGADIVLAPGTLAPDVTVAASFEDASEVSFARFEAGAPVENTLEDGNLAPSAYSVAESIRILGDLGLTTEVDDTLIGNDSGWGETLEGGAGNDTVEARGGSDVVQGGAGDDSIDGGDGDDSIDGGTGDDDIDGGAGGDTIRGKNGDDTVDGGAGEDVIFGQAGDDVLNGNGAIDIIDGGSGADEITGGGGNDVLEGGDGDFNDIISGGSGDDEISGGWFSTPGDDGTDVLTGGAGADTFFFDGAANSTGTGLGDGTPGGEDVITDFTDGDDAIDADFVGASPAVAVADARTSRLEIGEEVTGAAAGTDRVVVFDIGGGNAQFFYDDDDDDTYDQGEFSVILEGFTAADLDGADFV